MTTSVVVVDGDPLEVDQIVRIARGTRMELGPLARERILASRAVVDRHVSGDELIYGLNTGLGHMRNVRVPLESLRAYQPAIVAMHAGGIGPALPDEIVRAAMAVRVAGIARGGAGTSLGVAETLIGMLNAGVHPVVARTGSVGASDLMHMAAIGLVVIGEGRASYQGETLPGGAALSRAGIAPARLEPKDGLALVSANGMSIGHAVLLTARADLAARLADVALAASLEAIGGNLSIVDDAVALAKQVAGQRESATFIRALLLGSDRCLAGAANSVQDPLSFRVGPQVHGALRETTRYLREQVNIELAAMDDNPLVDIDSGRMISNGNFHPLAMALAADALRPALAHVGQLSDRRLNHLWTVVAADIDVTDMSAQSASDLAGLLMRYASAVRYAELREIAGPVTLDIAPLDLGVEDHATNAVAAVQRSETALDLLEDLLTVELLVSAAVLRRVDAGTTTLGKGVAPMLAAVAAVVDDLGVAPTSDEIHAALKRRLYDSVLPAAESAAEEPA
ncbi:MAG: aromatic amino acid ammonia-lyase [Candidatus Limnocylindrales bacterium]